MLNLGDVVKHNQSNHIGIFEGKKLVDGFGLQYVVRIVSDGAHHYFLYDTRRELVEYWELY